MKHPIPALTLLPLPDAKVVPGGQFTVNDATRLRSRLVDPDHVTADANGVVRWNANNAIVPDFVYKDAYAVCPPAQQAAYSAHLDAFFAEYRKRDPRLEGENLAEAMANFPPGTELVNVITGRRTRLPGRKVTRYRER